MIYSEKAIKDFYNFVNPNFDYQEWFSNPNSTQTPNKIKINIYDDQEASLKLIKFEPSLCNQCHGNLLKQN